VVDGLGADRLAPPRLITTDIQRRDGLQASFAAQDCFEVANRRSFRRQGCGLFGALAALGPFLERLPERPACLVGRQESIGKRSQESGAFPLGLGNLVFPSGLLFPPTVRRSVAEMPDRTYQVQSVSIARHRLCRVAGVLGNEGFEGRIAVPDDVAEVEMLGAGALLPPPPQRRQRNVEAFRRLLFCEIHGPLVHGQLQTNLDFGIPIPSVEYRGARIPCIKVHGGPLNNSTLLRTDPEIQGYPRRFLLSSFGFR